MEHWLKIKKYLLNTMFFLNRGGYNPPYSAMTYILVVTVWYIMLLTGWLLLVPEESVVLIRVWAYSVVGLILVSVISSLVQRFRDRDGKSPKSGN